MTVVGDVHGKIALMIVSPTQAHTFQSCDSHVIQDDVIDDLDHLIAAAKCLKERGAYRVCVVATHGVFTKTATELLEASDIDQVHIDKYLDYAMFIMVVIFMLTLGYILTYSMFWLLRKHYFQYMHT